MLEFQPSSVVIEKEVCSALAARHNRLVNSVGFVGNTGVIQLNDLCPEVRITLRRRFIRPRTQSITLRHLEDLICGYDVYK